MLRNILLFSLMAIASHVQSAEPLSGALSLRSVHQSGWLQTEVGEPGQPPFYVYLPQVKLYRNGTLVLAGQAFTLSKLGAKLASADAATRVSPRVRIRDLAAERTLLGLKGELSGNVLIWAHPDGCDPCESLMARFRREVLVHYPGDYRLVDVTVD